MQSGESVKECRAPDAFKIAGVEEPKGSVCGGPVNPVSVQPGPGYWESVGQPGQSGPVVVDSVCEMHRAELKKRDMLSPGSA